MKRQITAILIGAGNRGNLVYGRYALNHPEELKIVGVAEKNPTKCEVFSNTHKISKENQFNDWKDILNKPKFADIAIIATPDKIHTQPALKAMEKNYHVLIEKPMATNEKDCRSLIKKSEKIGVTLQVSHVLRYTEFFRKIKEIIDSGKIGKIMVINQSENFINWMYSHSFVRGILSDKKNSSPMILTKCCHDFDILYWLVGSPPIKISSFAHPSYLTSGNKPKGSPKRCIEGCKYADECQYNAVDIYLNILQPRYDFIHSNNFLIKNIARLSTKNKKLLGKLLFNFAKFFPKKYWKLNHITENFTEESFTRALKEGPYGNCVYSCNNNQVSSQVTNIEFSNGTVATLTMHGHSHQMSRRIRIDGTKGSLVGNFTSTGNSLVFHDHLTGKSTKYKMKLFLTGHGGGDQALIKTFLDTIRGESRPLTTARESLQSHLMAFAADHSYRKGKIVYLNNNQ